MVKGNYFIRATINLILLIGNLTDRKKDSDALVIQGIYSIARDLANRPGSGIIDAHEVRLRHLGYYDLLDLHLSVSPRLSVTGGYIEKNKLVSLRGTLVPATTINKVISAIPIVGQILVGSKTGEGVFGVSFKIKGPPKKFETSVNPIKTLTPRFITRTLEKIKKN